MFHIPHSILKFLKNVQTTQFHLNFTYTKVVLGSELGLQSQIPSYIKKITIISK